MPLVELPIDELSQLQCTYGAPDDDSGLVDVLVVSFAGTYGHGSLGNSDATYIVAKTMAGLAAYEPCSLILDFQEMSYEWGNSIKRVWQHVSDYLDEPDEYSFPVFVVTSDRCREAFLSLFGKTEAEASVWHFRNLDDALVTAKNAAKEYLDS